MLACDNVLSADNQQERLETPWVERILRDYTPDPEANRAKI
jgi:hypothetical protein